MTAPIYPMGPIMDWSTFHGIQFSMRLVKRVESFGRAVVAACGLETA